LAKLEVRDLTVATFERAIASPSAYLQARGIGGLAAIGRDVEAHLPALVALLGHPDASVQANAEAAFQHLGARAFIGQRPCVEVEAPGTVVIVFEEPAVRFLGDPPQHVEFVIAEQALRRAFVDHLADTLDHAGAVGSAVAEVADEDEAARLRVLAAPAVTEHAKQVFQRVDFAVDVADDVDRPVEGAPDQGRGAGQGRTRSMPLALALRTEVAIPSVPSMCRAISITM
jgi:hypothetical protein